MSTPTAHELAEGAQVATPDSATSPGARWLRAVYEDAVETFSRTPAGDEDTARHEVARDAVPTWEVERWQVFTDLCAWQVEVPSPGPADISDRAGVALYLIAHRVCRVALDNMTQED